MGWGWGGGLRGKRWACARRGEVKKERDTHRHVSSAIRKGRGKEKENEEREFNSEGAVNNAKKCGGSEGQHVTGSVESKRQGTRADENNKKRTNTYKADDE